MRPAMTDIGAISGKPPAASRTISKAIAVAPRAGNLRAGEGGVETALRRNEGIFWLAFSSTATIVVRASATGIGSGVDGTGRGVTY